MIKGHQWRGGTAYWLAVSPNLGGYNRGLGQSTGSESKGKAILGCETAVVRGAGCPQLKGDDV